MWLPFMLLLMFNGAIGVVTWLLLRRVFDHMRRNPEAAKLVAEHVIAPILAGKEPDKPKEEPERVEGTII